MTNQGKNEDGHEKIWKNKFAFWIFHIKIRLCGNFDWNLWTKSFDSFLGHFWLIEAKMTMKLKIFGKSEFNFSILHIKIRLYRNFHENEDEDEKKIWENEFNIWILHIKIRLNGTFHKNVKKNFFSKFLPAKHILGQGCWKG